MKPDRNRRMRRWTAEVADALMLPEAMKPDRNRRMRPWALGMAVMLGVLFVFGGLAGCGEEKVESPNAKTAAPARAPGENVQQEKRGK